MEQVAQQAVTEAFKYDFLIGVLLMIIFLQIVALAVMWRYLTRNFSNVVKEFKESLDNFTGTLHELKGIMNMIK